MDDIAEKIMAIIASTIAIVLIGAALGAHLERNEIYRAAVEHNHAHWNVKNDGTTVFEWNK